MPNDVDQPDLYLQFTSEEDLKNGYRSFHEVYSSTPQVLNLVGNILNTMNYETIAPGYIQFINRMITSTIGDDAGTYLIHTLRFGVDRSSMDDEVVLGELLMFYARYNKEYTCSLEYIKNPLNFASYNYQQKDKEILLTLFRADKEKFILNFPIQRLGYFVERTLDMLIEGISESGELLDDSNHQGLLLSFENYLKAVGGENEDEDKTR